MYQLDLLRQVGLISRDSAQEQLLRRLRRGEASLIVAGELRKGD